MRDESEKPINSINDTGYTLTCNCDHVFKGFISPPPLLLNLPTMCGGRLCDIVSPGSRVDDRMTGDCPGVGLITA